MIFGLEQEGGSLIAPMALAHPLHPIDNRSRNKRRNLWVGRCVSSWWPWFPSRSSVLTYMFIYMYVHSLYEFCYRSYIQWECHSVLAKLHPMTFYRGVRGSWAECHFFRVHTHSGKLREMAFPWKIREISGNLPSSSGNFRKQGILREFRLWQIKALLLGNVT